MRCENCDKQTDEESKRFCTIRCARSFATKASRLERNKKIADSLRGKSSKSREPTIHKFFCQYCSTGYAKKTSLGGHVVHCSLNPNMILKESKWDKERELLLSLDYGQVPDSLKKEKIFRDQKGCCNRCSLSEWLGEKITLEIEHKDGDHYNNSRENVELLCPNCHSLTDTWRGRNKTKSRSSKRVSDEEMVEALKGAKSIRQALLKVGLAAKGGNYFRAKRIKESMGL